MPITKDNPVVQRQDLRQRLAKFGSTLIGFILGAACGAFMMCAINFCSILLPTLAIAKRCCKQIALLAIDRGRHEAAHSQVEI